MSSLLNYTLTINKVSSDRIAQPERRTSHDELRPLAGIDEMLRLSGLFVQLTTQMRFLLHHCKTAKDTKSPNIQRKLSVRSLESPVEDIV